MKNNGHLWCKVRITQDVELKFTLSVVRGYLDCTYWQVNIFHVHKYPNWYYVRYNKYHYRFNN